MARVVLLVGIALPGARAGAQQRPPAPTPAVPIPGPAPDSAARASKDSVRGIPDTLRTPPVRRDSIQPPITRGELPVGVTAGPSYRFRGDTVLATGALTVLDLLERVPGLSGFRSGFIASIQTAAYNGDFRRVRLFRDGVELDPVDARGGAILDLIDLPLWQAEDVSVEPTAGEVRVHVRTRTVRNRTPQTRVDILTGDDETNLYRAFYGKRFGNGGLIQVTAQQYGTGSRNRRTGGGGDATNPVIRLGWANRRGVSVDAFVARLNRQRNVTVDATSPSTEVLPFQEARRDETYLRVGLGDPEQGFWAQAIANTLRYRNGDANRTAAFAAADTTDSTRALRDTSLFRAQYLLAGGVNRWGVRFSGTGRVRVYDGRTDVAPQLRASYDRRRLNVWALAERAGVDSSRRLDVTARVAPLNWVAFVVAGSQTNSEAASAPGARRVARAEAAVRIGDAWLAGGRVVRGSGVFLPPLFYSQGTTPETLVRPAAYTEGRANGTIGSLRGRVYKDLQADVNGVVWDGAGAFRPKYQGRAELRLLTNWRSRFPSGEFGANIAVFDEYRSEMFAPFRAPGDTTDTVRRAAASNQLGAQVEFRLQSAVITFQIRNALGRRFEYVPGLRAPGAISVYGVRWEFGN